MNFMKTPFPPALFSPGEDFQLVTRQVKEAESNAEIVTQVVMAVRGTMERTMSAWETHNKCLASLQTWLEQTMQSQTQPTAVSTQVGFMTVTMMPNVCSETVCFCKKTCLLVWFLQDMSEWMSCQAKLNEVGNFLIEVTDTSTSHSLAEQLSKVNKQWAECMKRAKFVSMHVVTVLLMLVLIYSFSNVQNLLI